MSDLIDRQNAITVLEILADKMSDEGQIVMAQAVAVLKDLRSAEPEQKTGKCTKTNCPFQINISNDCDIKTCPYRTEQKKGKWQRRKGGDCWECSECHAVLESDDIVRHNFYYCYHCGADMMSEDGYMKLEGTEYE